MRNGRLQFERRWNATGAALELDLTPLKRRSSKMRFLKCTNISALQLRSEYVRSIIEGRAFTKHASYDWKVDESMKTLSTYLAI